MYTIKLKFDKEKILKEGLSFNQMIQSLDKICADSYFIKVGEGEYKLNDGEDVTGALLVLTSRFEKQSWLFQNLKSWKANYDNMEEDLLALYKEIKEKNVYWK